MRAEQVAGLLGNANSSTQRALRALATTTKGELPRVKCMEWGMRYMAQQLKSRCDERWVFNYAPGAFRVDRSARRYTPPPTIIAITLTHLLLS